MKDHMKILLTNYLLDFIKVRKVKPEDHTISKHIGKICKKTGQKQSWVQIKDLVNNH